MAEVRPRVRRSIWWLGLGGCVALAAGATTLAYLHGLPPIFDEVPHLDKVVHFGVFGAIAFFLDPVLRRRAVRPGVPLAALAVAVPAGIEELLQSLSVNRSSSLGDWLADVAGVAFFLWLSRRVDR